jgi:hypothetical protein
MNCITYLGFSISVKGIEPGKRAINEFPVPIDVHKVRSFLGLVSFFQTFCKRVFGSCETVERSVEER